MSEVKGTEEMNNTTEKKMTKRMELKEELKKIALQIKKGKPFWRHFNHTEFYKQFEGIEDYKARYTAQKEAMDLLVAQYSIDPYGYRHRHIAYCMLRGKKYEQIELKVKPGNEANMKLVEMYVAEYTDPVILEEVGNG